MRAYLCDNLLCACVQTSLDTHMSLRALACLISASWLQEDIRIQNRYKDALQHVMRIDLFKHALQHHLQEETCCTLLYS